MEIHRSINEIEEILKVEKSKNKPFDSITQKEDQEMFSYLKCKSTEPKRRHEQTKHNTYTRIYEPKQFFSFEEANNVIKILKKSKKLLEEQIKEDIYHDPVIKSSIS